MRLMIAALVAVLFVGEAAAQSCSSLRKQLAAAQNSSGNVSQLRAQHRAYNCGVASRFGRNRRCGSIEAQLSRAGGGNVAALQRRVASACDGGGASRVARKQDRRRAPSGESMMIGGRVVSGVHSGNSGRRSGGILSGIFGDRRREVVVEARHDPNSRVERLDLGRAQPGRASGGTDAYSVAATRSSGHRKGQSRYGNSRTVCVRLCDGFYFPINNNSHSDNYYDELAMCVGRCPGADVSLYAHSNGAPVESMRSTMTGERYVNLPTAFTYRKRVVGGCGCQPQSIGNPSDPAVDQVVASLQAEGSGATASDGAPEADGQANWTPYQAVYDQTGKPLAPLKTDRTSEPPERPSGLTLPPRPGKDNSVTTLAMDRDAHFREVGPQFFSTTETMVGETQPARRRGAVVTSAVTVIPLGTGAPRQAQAVSPEATVTPAGSTAPRAGTQAGIPTGIAPE